MSILARLKEYADLRMELPPPMYGIGNVRWLVDIDDDGNLVGFISLGDDKNNKFGVPMVTPQVPPVGSGIKPRLLIDTGERVFGIPKTKPKPSDPKRVALYHQSFKELTKYCAETTQEASVKAISKFIEAWNPESDGSRLPPGFDPSHVVTFRCIDIIPADARAELKEIEGFWARNFSSAKDDQNSPIMTCLVTGNLAPVAQRMPVPIKGIPGKRPELALVSANEDTFSSYKLKNSLTSPISYEAGEHFAKALNFLLSDEQSRIYIGNTAFIWWTREKTGFNPLTLLGKPTPEAVKTLLESPMSSKKASSFDSTKAEQFYALALTANNARAVVRDWLETTVPNVQASIQSWFRHQELVDPYGDKPRPFGTYVLAASLYRDAAKEMQAAVPTALMRGAILGERLPEDLLVKIVRRNRVEREITYPRAVLLKLILSRHPSYQDSMTNMEQLNPDPNLQGSDRIAYACGRLLAVLESTQRLAVGSVNAALTDRYYGAASSTPAIAFPPLLKLSRAHFSKLRKTKPGACKAIEERFEEITCQISTFPKTFNLQQQGLFGLGYYHQKASERAQFRK